MLLSFILQVYKFLYVTRLLDYGLTSLALHYCECIAYALLSSGSGSSVLISELIKVTQALADILRYPSSSNLALEIIALILYKQKS